MARQIDGILFKKMIISGFLSISQNKSAVNELNVFPVPDGDTGTNMALTMQNAKNELLKFPDEDLTLPKCADTAASALLRGARGNSGVILSLLFRGISKKLREYDKVSGTEFALSLKEGVQTAYNAVMKPAEGTILTVSRVCAQHAVEICQADNQISVEKIFKEIIDKANQALIQTEFQNPVLQKAGVVDAGAYGFICILEGMRDAFMGKEIKITDAQEQKIEASHADFSAVSHDDIHFAYCTEFIAQRKDKSRNVKRMSAILDKIGDSIVVVEDNDIIKVHVHTNEPDKALCEGLKFGPLSAVKIENMKEQHTSKIVEQQIKNQEEYSKARTVVAPSKKYGFVSIAAGEGLISVFRDLGVDTMVEGGQTMNPSTQDILRAVDKTPAEIVFVLPNNKNIIMAAEQASHLSESKKVVVIPTKNIPQGISAMLSFDENIDFDSNVNLMNDVLSNVRSGQITYAARDAEFDGKKIKQGEYLALFEGRLCANFKKGDDATRKLAREMTKKSASFATIIYGENIKEEHANHVAEIFKKENKGLEITVINGGQPVYYFIISVE